MRQRFLLAMFAMNSVFGQIPEDKFVIGTLPNEGFFSSFISVVNLLLWADKNNKVPIVQWNERSLFHQSEEYNGSTNAWEYYFEPVSDLTYSPLDAAQVWNQGAAPDESHLFISYLSDPDYFHKEYKFKANETIQKFVKIKSSIQNKIDSFYNEKMAGKTTIGIHLRGTDSSTHRRVTESITTEAIQAAQAAAKNFKGPVQYFIATDDEGLLNLVKAKLKGDIIYCDSHRSTDGSALHTKKAGALVGEEVLIEGMLLAKCDYLVHSHSSVPIAIMTLNPRLQTEFIDPKPWIFKHVYGIAK